ncbi:MAG: molybdopterin-dependent oxidoreductase [Deltaproteobacteria bacterium]|nr:molybdopterin-dependent oxidoreductase [Deltaproteobacteria bacterium]MBW2019575.1 molybdopterin-dependent oxidoreductase [Deltaproteobacteria bacterium]MBW2074403.1 molybdopterin-dependent oxidoreductase [Deltaproteobacteria bacterium]
MKKVVYTLCFMCSIRCPIKVVVEDDEIVSIEGNPYVGAMKGGVCPKGAAATGLLNDTERLQAPMIRTGPRGSGQWKRVSWDEALDYTAEKCKEIFSKYGSKSAAWCERTNFITDLSKTFTKAIGTPNYFTHDALCKGSVNTACRSLFGYTDAQISVDYGNTKHIVLYGRNIFEAIEVKAVNNLLDAMGKGAKLTYVDPRVTITAAKSTRYLMIRPGTDLALNYALMNVIIKERLFDAEYVDRWVDGFEKLRTFVDRYTPEWAEEETGIPANEIVALAQELDEAKPSVIFHYGYRGANHPNEIYFRRSLLILNALMGSVEAKGGIFFKKGPKDAGHKAGLRNYSSQKFPKMEDTRRFDGCGQDKYPIADPAHGVGGMFPLAVLNEDPYPIKVLFAFRFDPLYSIPDLNQNLKALEKLDLIVSIDINWGGITWMSDVVLPESTFLERSDPIKMFPGLKPAPYRRVQCVTPRYDTKPGWWIVKALAERLGAGEYFPYESIEDIWDYQLADLGLKPEDFEAKGFVELSDKPIWWDRKDGLKFKTPSGKIEFVSSLMEEHGFPSFPPYEKLETPESTFRLMVGRCAAHTHVATQNNPYLNELVSENVLWINNKKAEALGIKNNEMVEVSSKVDKGTLRAFVTDLIHPEAVFILHGFGHQEAGCTRSYKRGVADTLLQEHIMDTIGGSPALDHTLVSVKKA